jgi:hypothetical protein
MKRILDAPQAQASDTPVILSCVGGTMTFSNPHQEVPVIFKVIPNPRPEFQE